MRFTIWGSHSRHRRPGSAPPTPPPPTPYSSSSSPQLLRRNRLDDPCRGLDGRQTLLNRHFRLRTVANGADERLQLGPQRFDVVDRQFFDLDQVGVVQLGEVADFAGA